MKYGLLTSSTALVVALTTLNGRYLGAAVLKQATPTAGGQSTCSPQPVQHDTPDIRTGEQRAWVKLDWLAPAALPRSANPGSFGGNMEDYC